MNGIPIKKRVQQEHPFGCQVAVLAMLFDISYSKALTYYPHCPGDTNGFSSFTLETILVENGFSVAKMYKFRTGFGNEPRKVWPPLPFSKIHWCEVITVSGSSHAVIMLQDGTVLDPWCEKRDSLRHPDYKSVSFVAAVSPIRDYILNQDY